MRSYSKFLQRPPGTGAGRGGAGRGGENKD